MPLHFTESPREQCVRLYTTTKLTPDEIIIAAQVSRPTLYRYLKASGVALTRRSHLQPSDNEPRRMGLKKRSLPSGHDTDEVMWVRRGCQDADCLPFEQPHIEIFRFQMAHVNQALIKLHAMRLTVISNAIGAPAGWGVWLVGPKYFTDPAANPGYPLSLNDCIEILENPRVFIVANAEKIKGYIERRRQEITERLNMLVGTAK